MCMQYFLEIEYSWYKIVYKLDLILASYNFENFKTIKVADIRKVPVSCWLLDFFLKNTTLVPNRIEHLVVPPSPKLR